jgi:hypothetical protein
MECGYLKKKTTKYLISKFVLANLKLPQTGGKGQASWGFGSRLGKTKEEKTNYVRNQGGDQEGLEARALQRKRVGHLVLDKKVQSSLVIKYKHFGVFAPISCMGNRKCFSLFFSLPAPSSILYPVILK